MSDLFAGYATGEYYDEMFEVPGKPRPHYRELFERLQGLSMEELVRTQSLADGAFLDQGITFTVYGDPHETERMFPVDLLPRIIPNSE